MLSENKRLFDLSTRIALYIEGVKAQQSGEFNLVLFELSETFKKLLGNVQYSTLDGLSKAQLNKLVLELRKSQSKIYSKYTEKLLKQLADFTAAALQVNRRVYASEWNFSHSEDDTIEILSDEDSAELISDIDETENFVPLFGLAALLGRNEGIYKAGLNTPLSANGFYPIPFLKTFSNSAQASAENIIRKGWANQQTPNEVLIELIGNPNQPVGTSSQVKRIRNQASAVIETTFAHFASLAASAVQSALFGRYMWVSIIDDATTDICRERNGRIYEYGSGPIPPAHIRCRSHIRPLSILNDKIDETYYNWMSSQPENIQVDFLGKKAAESLRNGLLKSKDLSKLAAMPITIKGFLGKVGNILT